MDQDSALPSSKKPCPHKIQELWLLIASIISSLAYAEMRYIAARILWNFDYEIAPESVQWAEGLKSWLVWEKQPLYVHLKPRRLK